MNKKQYFCRYSSSNASPVSSDIPPDPKVGDVHKDLSSNTWWVYQRPAPDGPMPEGRVGRWQSYSGEFAFEHPDSIASTRYTWYTIGQVWRVHHNNPSPVAPSIKGVKVILIILVLYLL